ncbi:MAG: class I adenylate-forming enzyme family protein [Pseudomonadota bacterium]
MPLVGPPLERPLDPRDLLSLGLGRKPDEIALASLEARWSWRELERAVDCLAGNLLALGLAPGDRIASLMPNRAELLIHYLACFRAGLVATPLNYRYMAAGVDHAIEVAEPAALLSHVERAADLADSKLAGRLPLGQITFGGSGPGPRLEELTSQAPADWRPPSVPSDAPAVIFFTSGSTGPPKGVTHSHETLGWTLASFGAISTLTPADVVLPASSLSHGGSFKLSLAGLGAGAQVGVARSRDADYLLPLLRRIRPTRMLTLPSTLFSLVRAPGAEGADFASLRFLIVGGDKVAAELQKEFDQLTGLELREGYGMTEIGPAAGTPPDLPTKPGSLGRPGPSFTLSIRDESGLEVPAGKEGRLWAKSPCIMTHYWNNEAATRAAFTDGWFDTGDVMRADEDGYLWFRGRRKQIIVHDGSNICPQDVEGALIEHPAVANAGVVGIHDLLHGEDVRAYVTLKKEACAPSEAELIDFARARVGYKAPEEIVVLEEMPFTVTGKVDRAALKQLAGG